MPNIERIRIIEFTLGLMREEMAKDKKLSLKEAAELMVPFYTEGSQLTEFVDSEHGDFYEYEDYAERSNLDVSY
jgi:hypothetical protein